MSDQIEEVNDDNFEVGKLGFKRVCVISDKSTATTPKR